MGEFKTVDDKGAVYSRLFWGTFVRVSPQHRTRGDRSRRAIWAYEYETRMRTTTTTTRTNAYIQKLSRS